MENFYQLIHQLATYQTKQLQIMENKILNIQNFYLMLLHYIDLQTNLTQQVAMFENENMFYNSTNRSRFWFFFPSHETLKAHQIN